MAAGDPPRGLTTSEQSARRGKHLERALTRIRALTRQGRSESRWVLIYARPPPDREYSHTMKGRYPGTPAGRVRSGRGALRPEYVAVGVGGGAALPELTSVRGPVVGGFQRWMRWLNARCCGPRRLGVHILRFSCNFLL